MQYEIIFFDLPTRPSNCTGAYVFKCQLMKGTDLTHSILTAFGETLNFIIKICFEFSLTDLFTDPTDCNSCKLGLKIKNRGIKNTI